MSTGILAAAALLVTLTGCGSRDSTGSATDALVDEALDSTFGATSLTTTTRTKQEGVTVVRSTVADGTPECHMRMSKGSAVMDFLVNETGAYSRGSEEALRLGGLASGDMVPGQLEAMAGRWVKRDDTIADMMRNDLCDARAQRDKLEENLPSPDELSTGAQREGVLHGRPTTKVTFVGQWRTLELHIAAEGKPYVLKAVDKSRDLDVSFRGFGKPYRTSTPADAVDEQEIAQEILENQ